MNPKRTIYISNGERWEPADYHYEVWDNYGEDWKRFPYRLAEVKNGAHEGFTVHIGFNESRFRTIKAAKTYCVVTYGEVPTRG